MANVHLMYVDMLGVASATANFILTLNAGTMLDYAYFFRIITIAKEVVGVELS